MKLPLEDHDDDVRAILVDGEPVLVLGPGVRRIGFDDVDSPGWPEVTRRMRVLYADFEGYPAQQSFLDAYWRSKLSTDALEQARTLPNDFAMNYGLAVTGAPPVPALTDRVRMGLAAPLLRTLIDCTRCLGESIRTGEVPVVSWHSFSDRSSPTGSGKEADDARDHATEELKTCAARAEGLWRWRHRQTLSLSPYADELSAIGFGERELARESTDLARATVKMLRILNIGAIAKSARYLVEHCLEGETLPLSGAMIEWLSDLLWHVLTSDSAVPPSQAHLAFYVNLRRTDEHRPRVFSRAVPGEYRISVADLPAGQLPDPSREVKLRLERGANGLQQSGRPSRDDDRHQQVTSTMAATLAVMWRAYDGHADNPKPRRQLPIALSSGYDLALERQLLELLQADLAADQDDEPRRRAFHIVVPVWLTYEDSPERRLDWLWGTYVVHEEGFTQEQLTSHEGGMLTWDWYRSDLETDGRQPIGPIIVKVNGSPLLELGRGATSTSLKLASRPEAEEASIQLATIFSEHDSVTSMITFSTDNKGLPETILTHLRWDKRSWVFLGDSLPDWIPRLRLLFNARSALSGGRRGQRGGIAQLQTKIAIDRAFDWPEEAMLEALKVTAYTGDLGWLADLPDPSPPSVAWFWNAVRVMIDNASRRPS